MNTSRRIFVAALILSCAAATSSYTAAIGPNVSPNVLWTTPPLDGKPGVLVAAIGDVTCDPTPTPTQYRVGDCENNKAVAELIPTNVERLLVLGDAQYSSGTLNEYLAGFDTIFGGFKDRITPVPGNHDYITPNAVGYYSYFGTRGHQETNGFSDEWVGNWHVYSLNSNCASIGGCGPSSAQGIWLKNTLNADPSGTCQVAIYHHPSWTRGSYGNASSANDVGFATLVDAGVELVLSGHDHMYERSGPLNRNRGIAQSNGTIQFVSGFGGVPAYPLKTPDRNLLAYSTSSHGGVLFLKLDTNSWESEFRGLDGYNDTSHGSCQMPRISPPLPSAAYSTGKFFQSAKKAVLGKAPGALYAATGSFACAPDNQFFNNGWGIGNWCRTRFVTRLINNQQPTGVFIAGGAQQSPNLTRWGTGFDTIWGAVKLPLIVASSAADLQTGTGFLTKFGENAAGPVEQDLANGWKAYVLPGSCGSTNLKCPSDTYLSTWVTNHLAADGIGVCQVVISANSAKTAGYVTNGKLAATVNAALVAGGAEILVVGGDRSYQRFTWNDNAAHPTTEFITGAGGQSLQQLTISPTGLEAFDDTHFGVLWLKLAASSYQWEWQSASETTKPADTGQRACLGTTLQLLNTPK